MCAFSLVCGCVTEQAVTTGFPSRSSYNFRKFHGDFELVRPVVFHTFLCQKFDYGDSVLQSWFHHTIGNFVAWTLRPRLVGEVNVLSFQTFPSVIATDTIDVCREWTRCVTNDWRFSTLDCWHGNSSGQQWNTLFVYQVSVPDLAVHYLYIRRAVSYTHLRAHET